MDPKTDAKRVFAGWARRFRIRPWKLEHLVSKVESVESTYGRAITRWTRRQPVWRTRPHMGRKRVADAPVSIEDVSPWDIDEAVLADESFHVASCSTCEGAKKIDYPTCAATSKVACVECGGGGRVASRSANNNNTVSCRKCRGSGLMKCATCRNGRVTCPPCEGKGKLEVWIAVETQPLTHVGIWPSGLHAQAHPGLGDDSTVADVWPGAVLAEELDGCRLLASADVGPLANALQWDNAKALVEPVLDTRLDRVRSQSVRVYETPITKVTAAFSGLEGELHLLGRELRPTLSFDAAPFESYAHWVTRTAVVVAVVTVVLAGGYATRDRFFVPSVGWFLLALLLAGLGALVFVAAWRRDALPTSRRPRLGPVAIAGIASVGLGLAGAALITGLVHPSADEAVVAVQDGNFDEATRHLEALDRLGVETSQTTHAWVNLIEALALVESDDLDRIRVLPKINDRFGDHERLAALRIDTRLALLERALRSADSGTAREHFEHLQDEPGREAPQLLARMRTLFLEGAQDIVDEEPAAAEKILVIGWARWAEDPEYRKLGEEAIVGQAQKADRDADRLALLRRADALKVSATPANQLESIYETQLEKYVAEGPRNGAELWEIASQREHLYELRKRFPEHEADIDVSLKPVEAAWKKLSEQQRRKDKRAARKRESKAKRGTSKAHPRERDANARPVHQPAARMCCRYCSSGKPCGDSCIARNKTCHKGGGCAC